MKRVILIVLDSVGVGALPDAHRFGDENANTLAHIVEETGLELPNLRSLGLGNIPGSGIKPISSPKGFYGKAMEQFPGKDTTGGHWEIAGILAPSFPTFPEGFPQEVIDAFCAATGVSGVLGNEAASGTEIIMRLGDEHVATGKPIVYTSADSVFQIAAHEGVIPIDRQYDICKTARDVLTGDFAVGRVIARPFEGESGQYTRTVRRRDFSLPPTDRTMLDAIAEAGLEVWGVGKIEDIFVSRGLTRSEHTVDNPSGIQETLRMMGEGSCGLIFTNLVDFDMLYGHRNDVEGYAAALAYFDKRLPEIVGALKIEDLLVITSDHGCDPTIPGTDHTREYTPILAYGRGLSRGGDLGVRESFADIAATVIEYLGLGTWPLGKSFAKELKGE
ncbi:MAG: phosphopentomutase [Christensenellales bacterium]|jgi:phosphopentomutase